MVEEELRQSCGWQRLGSAQPLKASMNLTVISERYSLTKAQISIQWPQCLLKMSFSQETPIRVRKSITWTQIPSERPILGLSWYPSLTSKRISIYIIKTLTQNRIRIRLIRSLTRPSRSLKVSYSNRTGKLCMRAQWKTLALTRQPNKLGNAIIAIASLKLW